MFPLPKSFSLWCQLHIYDMKLPGFTADISVHNTANHYFCAESKSMMNLIVPSMRPKVCCVWYY